MDQLMNLAWKFMLPMALINLLTVGVWHFMATGILRWLVCTVMIAMPCIVLGRGLRRLRKFQVRTYSYAE
jgi:NADH-quinone oxidoreductase subunit H